jgi:hypothetical protein
MGPASLRSSPRVPLLMPLLSSRHSAAPAGPARIRCADAGLRPTFGSASGVVEMLLRSLFYWQINRLNFIFFQKSDAGFVFVVHGNYICTSAFFK